MEQDLRKKAITLYLKGGSPKSIDSKLNRSKEWFFKWLRRYQTGDPDWYKDKSRSPKSQPAAIRWELSKSGYGFPSDRTINRVLKKAARVKKTSNIPKGVEYPYFKEPLDYNNIHQADRVGPRYIKNDGKFYSFNVMDLFSHQVYIESQRTKPDRQVASSLLRCWKSVGLPDFLQLDNELSFRGSNRHPRSPGLVIRLCLYFGVQPVFIPIGEPWRNGVIEKFTNTYNKKFFRQQWFPSYSTLKRQSKNFQRFHNKHHRYSYLKGKTPLEFIQSNGYEPFRLGAITKLPDLDSVPDGNIILIRFIRSNRILDIFGEKFKVSKSLVYSYVKAVIVTEIHRLHLYLGQELVDSFDYQLST